MRVVVFCVHVGCFANEDVATSASNQLTVTSCFSKYQRPARCGPNHSFGLGASRRQTPQKARGSPATRKRRWSLILANQLENCQGSTTICSDIPTAVARHYGRGGLPDRLLAALTAAGKDIDHLTIDDLAPFDEFHSRRRRATEELARMLAPTPQTTSWISAPALADRRDTWRRPTAAASAAST